jgi:uncharacterized protein (TIGR02271 family)
MSETDDADNRLVVPLVAERLHLDKREVVTGGIRVRKDVVEHTETVHQALSSTHLEIDRVPVGRFVDEVPGIREEGGTTIIPLVEEVAVVQKRLWLREEVHVMRRHTTSDAPQTVTLHREELSVEPLSADIAQRAAEESERHD